MTPAARAVALLAAAAAVGVGPAGPSTPDPERLAQLRNLGKALYENPTTHFEAVAPLKQALDMAPDSVRERVNYGLALLRAGKTGEGIAELKRAQAQDPRVPHTWFNLGIEWKRAALYDQALEQFQGLVRLLPEDPVAHFNLGVLYRLTGKTDLALPAFEAAARLDPRLAGPHFQLANAYRRAGRVGEADREMALFREIKEKQAGAAVPEDLEWSWYAEIYDPIEAHSLPEPPPAQVSFESRKLAEGLDAATAGLLALDADADGAPDLLAWSSTGAMLLKGGSTRVTGSGLDQLRGVVAAAAGDFDNDGFADLAVLTRRENGDTAASLYRNRRGRFEKADAALPSGRFGAVVWLDYDHDYDLDLFLLGPRAVLMRNNGAAGFGDQTGSFPFVPGDATAAVVFDLLPDTDSMDLAVAYRDRPGVLYRDRLGGTYEARTLEALPAGTTSLLALDVDNDSRTDLAGAGETGLALVTNRVGALERGTAPTGARGPLVLADLESRGIVDLVAGTVVLRGDGLGGFAAGVGGNPAGLPAGVAALLDADFDADGRVDLAAVTTDGTLALLANRTASANGWLRVRLEGVKNAKLAPQAEVEVKAGRLYQKRTYRGLPLLFGLGARTTIDTVRITWPNGLIQNETGATPRTLQAYKEAPRLSGSCPMIFAWNGSGFAFVTDVLGVAPLGASSGDGSFFPVDHDEYVRIAGDALRPRDGRYELRVTEELREVSYLDQLRLVAVDHPAGVEVFTNEKFKGPPFPEFRLFGVKRRIEPVSARQQGRDVRERLLRRDRRYADGFRRDYTGVAERHVLDLDFGGAAPDARAILVLSGWVDWADGSTFRAASQASAEGLVLPYLQVKDASGRWVTAVEDMGIPAGKPKTIVVDLSGEFLSASRELRIVTNLAVYWDEIFLSEEVDAPEVRLTPLEASTAGLGFRGFSRPRIHPERKQPEWFDYDDWMPLSSWNPTPGLYTRYGDVRELVAAADDLMVIMGSGDELRLAFDAAALPPLPPGCTRDFLLLVDGWAKDGDANTAFSQSVEPLPFHAMSRYPYPPGERFPDGAVHRAWRERYNTRPALRLIRALAGPGSPPARPRSRPGLTRGRSIGPSLQLGEVLPATLGADAVAEEHVRPRADVGLELVPRAVVVADLLAVRADRQGPLQGLDLGGALGDQALELLVGAGQVAGERQDRSV